MNFRNSRSLLPLLLLSASLLAAGGCASSKGGNFDPTDDPDVSDTPDTDTPDVGDPDATPDTTPDGEDVTEEIEEPVEPGTLEAVSPTSGTFKSGEVIDLHVLFRNADGIPEDGAAVEYEFLNIADIADAYLPFRQLNTGYSDADTGVAPGSLVAGKAAVFTVRASSDAAENHVDFLVTIEQERSATYVLTATSDVMTLDRDDSGSFRPLVYDTIEVFLYDTLSPSDDCERFVGDALTAGVSSDALFATIPRSGIPLSEPLKPTGDGYDIVTYRVKLPESGNIPQAGDDADPPLTMAVALGRVGDQNYVGYDCVEFSLPAANAESTLFEQTFEMTAVYPDVSANYDLITNLDLVSAIPDNAEVYVTGFLDFFVDPVDFIVTEITNLLTDGDNDLTSDIISNIASSLLQEGLDSILGDDNILETISGVATDIDNTFTSLDFEGRLEIEEPPTRDGILPGVNSLTLNELLIDLSNTPGVNGPINQRIDDVLTAEWDGRVAISRQNADGLEYAIVMEPFSSDFNYGNLIEILTVQVALNNALSENFDDFEDVAQEYIRCQDWIEEAACDVDGSGDQDCDFWVDIAVLACEGARDFAVSYATDQLTGLTTSTGDVLRLGTDEEVLCGVHAVNTQLGEKYKFGNEAALENPSDWCVWDGSISGEPFDGLFYAQPR